MNLNDYASTISLVFKHIAKTYGDGNDPFGYADAMAEIHYFLDADTCAEIIEVAKEQDNA